MLHVMGFQIPTKKKVYLNYYGIYVFEFKKKIVFGRGSSSNLDLTALINISG